MALRRFYIGVENLALTPSQRDTLVGGIQQLGAKNGGSNPALRNHWRVRPDGDAAIFEAEFDEDNFSVLALRTRLAALFGVPLAQVTSATSNPASGTLLTMSYQSVARVRFLFFGGASATYAQSGDAARAYLAANAQAWGDA